MTIFFKHLTKLKIVLLMLLIIVPWLGLQSSSQLAPPLPSQEDLTFYEINPCKVSLITFLKANFNTFYQDHFFFRFNSSSPLSCFGLISGGTLIGTDLYISVGTNPLLNLLIQGSFWTLIISLLKKGDISTSPKNNFVHYTSIGLTSLLLCLFVYTEERFYQSNFYQLDTTDRRYLIILFIVSFFVVKNMIEIVLPRIKKVIYFIPASYIFIGTLEGFNINFIALVFVYFGFFHVSGLKKITKTYLYLIIVSSFWVMNSAYTGNGYFFQPGKLRGFTSSVYSFYSTIVWSIFFIFLIAGLIYIFKNYLQDLDLNMFTKIISFTCIPLVSLGYIGANFPVVNLFNYFYFGQQKYGVTLKNPFFFNEWSEKVSWRGFYPSAETVGEFFGLVLILILFNRTRKGSISSIELIGGLFAIFGLYFSNNRSAFIFVLFTLIYLSTINLNRKVRVAFLAIFTLVFLNIVGFQNLSYDYEFISNSVLDQANNYRLQEEASFLNSLNQGQLENGYSNKIFKFISAGGYLLNRGELWGIFLSRFNPTYLEFMFGSGPLNFGQLYGEIDIKPTKGTLLPHSSFLSYFVFIGLIGIILLFYKLIKQVKFNKKYLSSSSLILFMYIFANIFKNDSLNYFPTFILYSMLLYIILNLNSKKIFD